MGNIAETAGISPEPTSGWKWVSRSVWTDRMLNALTTGVQGGRWHNLIDKVFADRNMNEAFGKVAKNAGAPGVDGMTVKRYGDNLIHHQRVLSDQLRRDTYHPKAVRRTYVEKVGSTEKRPLGIPCVRDRIVQTALKHVMEPIFENIFHPSSHGFRPERSCKDALREVGELMDAGYVHIVDADIKGFFDAIDKSILMRRVREYISDGRVLGLVELFLNQEVMEGMACWEPETGTPQGGVVSPLLANIFLNPFDWFMQGNGIRIVRYADDFVLLCRTKGEAERALELAGTWMCGNRLTLHPEKTRLVDMGRDKSEFNFLGYRFKRHTDRRNRTRILKLVSRKSLKKVRGTIRERTSRCNGHSMTVIVNRVNLALRGWFNYFKHCRHGEMEDLDQFVRRRLRRILRKREKRKGGTGRSFNDHKRWPNTFFDEHGYLSLTDARLRAVQSLRGTC